MNPGPLPGVRSGQRLSRGWTPAAASRSLPGRAAARGAPAPPPLGPGEQKRRPKLPASAAMTGPEADTNTNIGGVPAPREEDPDLGGGGDILAAKVTDTIPPTPQSRIIFPRWRQPPRVGVDAH
eukprot:3770597-Pyramimonas_sp.AAC.1